MIAIGKSKTIGYQIILWYQQRTHGAKPKTSEKNKLPSVAIKAITQIKYR